MCPDHELISAHVDGEVPSPWRERIDEHLGSCPDCAAAAALYAGLGERLRAQTDGDEAQALARGRSRLDALLGGRPATAAPAGARRRSLSLPLPLAVAAAATILVLGAATALLALKPDGSAAIRTVASGEIPPLAAAATAQPASMEDLLRYLDARDGQITLTIKLPSGTTFGSAGKPVIMRSGRVIRGPAGGTPVGGSPP